MTHEEHAFSSADDAQLAYRSLSVPAIVGFLLGLASALVFLTPYLSLLPLVAAVVSFAAARSVLAATESKSGLGLALAGLFLSVAVGAADYARGAVLNGRHQSDAAEVADEFLRRLAAGDTVGAVELTVAFDERLPTAEAAQLYYTSDETAAEVLGNFTSNPVIEALSRGTEPAFKRAMPVSLGRFGKVYAARLYDAPGGEGSPVLLKLERTTPRGSGSAAWRVSEFEFAG